MADILISTQITTNNMLSPCKYDFSFAALTYGITGLTAV
jgi:hypothetical protein